MASLNRDAKGWRVLVVVAGKRRTIRLGKNVKVRDAQRFVAQVETLAAARAVAALPDEASALWLAKLPDLAYGRLVHAGLVEPREKLLRAPTLRVLLDDFFAAKSIKESTRLAYMQTRGSLERHFGADALLASITPLAAEKWRRALEEDEHLAPATAAKRAHTAKQIFRRAVRWGMLPESPFAGVKAGSQVNRARQAFVEQETIAKVIAAAPDAEWRLLIALARYGGLRTPSESLALRWQDVDWEHNRITIGSSKTEGHENGAERVIPLFPELREHLMAVFAQATEGSTFVITSYREGANLNPQLHRIVKRAGLKAWPRLWQNLRASRATELVQRYPAPTVAAWMGHSVAVAGKHYWQVRDVHFDMAAGIIPGGGSGADRADGSGPPAKVSDRSGGTQVAHPVAQHRTEPACTGPQSDRAEPVFQALTTACGSVQGGKWAQQDLNL